MRTELKELKDMLRCVYVVNGGWYSAHELVRCYAPPRIMAHYHYKEKHWYGRPEFIVETLQYLIDEGFFPSVLIP